MRRKRALVYLLSLLVVAALALGFTFRVGNAPLLGLDLEGGVSVVLHPTTSATDEQISQAITIMNQRINSLGVAEPDIYRQGDNIIVQIAGLKDADRDKAIALVGQTAELRFRPVMSLSPAAPTETTTGSTPGTTTATTPGTTTATTPGTTAATPTGSATVDSGDSSSSSTPPTGSPDGALGLGGTEGESAAGLPAQTTDSTVSEQPAGTTTTVAPTTVDPAVTTAQTAPPGSTAAPAPSSAAPLTGEQCKALSTASPTGLATPEADNQSDSVCKQVALPDDPRMVEAGSPSYNYVLGPACQPPESYDASCLTGRALDSARASLDQTGKWTVNPTFKGGADGIDKFNAMAAACNAKQANCPTGQLAITLDGLVVSAPTINEPSFSADQIVISGSFTEETARNLATSLNYGALPVQLEQLSAEQVSATLGRDALNAGLAAGLVGFILVSIYMLAWYRLLGLFAIIKLTIEGALLWAIISQLGASAGLALTLAGVTGIIVSIGVSLDSNVVYYEHMREDLRSGRSLRAAVDRSFSGAIGTIWKADGASLLGAVLLYMVAIGPVRGFAFFLGLSTVLDLISSYFYMHPVVYFATNSKLCQRRPGLFGLTAPPVGAGAERGGRSRPARPSSTRPSARTRGSGAATAVKDRPSATAEDPQASETEGHDTEGHDEDETSREEQ